jgi:ATP-binding cassette subfamily B (MDR/TAP) protein 1
MHDLFLLCVYVLRVRTTPTPPPGVVEVAKSQSASTDVTPPPGVVEVAKSQSASTDVAAITKPSEVPVVADAAANPAAVAEPELTVPFSALYRYADSTDLIMLAASAFFSACSGLVMPSFSLIFGDLLNSFNTQGALLDAVTKDSYYFLAVGAGAFLCAWAGIGMNMVVAERQAKRLREAYMTAVLRQDMAWFDQHKAGELSVRLTSDIEMVVEGMSQKLSMSIQFTTTFCTGLLIGFIKGWQLTLVILACAPFLAAGGAFIGQRMGLAQKQAADAYAKAGEVRKLIVP